MPATPCTTTRAHTDPKDTNGQVRKDQFGAHWYTLHPSGQKVEAEEEGGSDAS